MEILGKLKSALNWCGRKEESNPGKKQEEFIWRRTFGYGVVGRGKELSNP